MEIAKFTVVVDLPTPPFPLETMMKFFTCGAIFFPLLELLFSSGIFGVMILSSIFFKAKLDKASVAFLRISLATSGFAETISISMNTPSS